MIMNTGLFNRAQISYQAWKGETNEVQLLVTVEEMWYLYPIPVFELADRNFNVWWVDQKRSLDRTNYGVDFAHINLTGRKDKLKGSVKYGYTRKYALSYSMPYLNKAQTLGAFAGVGYWRNREINYRTTDSRSSFSGQKKVSFTSGLLVKRALPFGHNCNLITIWNLASRKSASETKSPWISTRTTSSTGVTASATLRCATTTSTKTGMWPLIPGRVHFAMAASSKKAWAFLGNAPGLPCSPVTENTSPGASGGAWAW